MKILHLIHRTWPYHGGAERYVWEHALAASRFGHSSTIVATDAWDMSWLVSKRGRHLQPGTFVKDNIEIIRFSVAHPPAQSCGVVPGNQCLSDLTLLTSVTSNCAQMNLVVVLSVLLSLGAASYLLLGVRLVAGRRAVGTRPIGMVFVIISCW